MSKKKQSEKSQRKRFRFGLKTLFVMLTLTSLAMVFLLNWRTVLIQTRADKVLVPMGIAIYSCPLGFNDAILEDGSVKMSSDRHKVGLILNQKTCLQCHTGGGGTGGAITAWIGFSSYDFQ
ncbi:MAG: hypothetical protein AAF939_19525 [Planctomycetota bacterium]